MGASSWRLAKPYPGGGDARAGEADEGVDRRIEDLPKEGKHLDEELPERRRRPRQRARAGAGVSAVVSAGDVLDALGGALRRPGARHGA